MMVALSSGYGVGMRAVWRIGYDSRGTLASHVVLVFAFGLPVLATSFALRVSSFCFAPSEQELKS